MQQTGVSRETMTQQPLHLLCITPLGCTQVSGSEDLYDRATQTHPNVSKEWRKRRRLWESSPPASFATTYAWQDTDKVKEWTKRGLEQLWCCLTSMVSLRQWDGSSHHWTLGMQLCWASGWAFASWPLFLLLTHIKWVTSAISRQRALWQQTQPQPVLSGCYACHPGRKPVHVPPPPPMYIYSASWIYLAIMISVSMQGTGNTTSSFINTSWLLGADAPLFRYV